MKHVNIRNSPLKRDDPGYLGNPKTYGLGSHEVNAQFAIMLGRERKEVKAAADASTEARERLLRLVAERDAR